MARETLAQKQARTQVLIKELRRAYPEAHCELEFSNPLELLIATILSAQCSDRQVNLVTRDLFAKYRSARDFAEASTENLEEDIRRIGLYRNKARFIKSCCQSLVERHGGEVPQDLALLTALTGVGRKTANVVLGNAFGINSGVVVDTHVARLAGRLRLSAEGSPEGIEKDLQKLVPSADWTLFSHLLIWHGRRRCRARNPDCVGCELRAWCPYGQRAVSTLKTPVEG